MLQRLLRQVANRLRGRWGGLTACVGPVNVNLVSAFGIRVCGLQTHVKSHGTTIAVQSRRRQRIHQSVTITWMPPSKLATTVAQLPVIANLKLVPKRSASSAQISA
jgi:hypothetical protein